MHEVPLSSWLLIAFATLPWLVLTTIHYLKNATKDDAPPPDQHEVT